MKKILLPLITAGLILLFYEWSAYSEPPATVQLTAPTIQAIQETVTLYGTVTDPAPKRVYAHGNAKVLEVFVKPGDTIQKGEPLLLLEPLDLPIEEETAAVFYQIKTALENGDFQTIEEVYAVLENPIISQAKPTQEEKAYLLYSTFDGIVLSVSASEGEQIGGFIPCLEVCVPEDLIITAFAGEEAIGKLKETMDCSVTIPAFSLEKLKGEVTTILPYAKKAGLFTTDSEVQTEIQIQLLQASSKLRPGYRATAKVVLSSKPEALLIPYVAVLQDEQNREYVMKYEDGYAVKQYILTSSELTDSVEVTDGLSSTDLIFLEPETIAEGSAVCLESN